MSRLISALFDQYVGEPILVIGGGPSASADLPELVALGVKPKCVISANDHGMKQPYFKVDYLVNCDKIDQDTMKPMQTRLWGHYGVEVINRHSWADYRLGDWSFVGNSGLTALAVAATFAPSAVYVTGLDFWEGGRCYFHDGKKRGYVARAMRLRADALAEFANLLQWCRGVDVRVDKGKLTEIFPSWHGCPGYRPGEQPYRKKHAGEHPVFVRSKRSFSFSTQDTVPQGAILALTPREAALPAIVRNCTPLAPDLQG